MAAALGVLDLWREDWPEYCSEGDACRPDFSAAGAPLRFGLATWLGASDPPAGAAVTLGLDNFRVTVWRK